MGGQSAPRLNKRGEGLLQTDSYDPDLEDDGLGPRGAGALSAADDDGDAGGATIVDDATIDDPGPADEPAARDDDPGVGGETEPPAVIEPDPEAGGAPVEQWPDWPPRQIALEDLDPAEILRDRPDVFEGFFKAFYGRYNDHHSPAWVDRVGAETPEAYALYWYKTYGVYEGYVPSSMRSDSGGQHSPLEPEAFGGRTTDDGIPLDYILHDRSDVFQGFFTAYYGAGNDHHSNAWNDRVGGETPQDYANYWYETYGKASGYGAELHGPAPAEEKDAETDDTVIADASPFGAPAGDDGIFLLT